MPTSLPLLTHESAEATVAWRDGAPIAAVRFLADVERLRRILPAGAHMLNACADRYRFAVGLGAALVAGKVSLLPSTQTPEMIRRMREFAPDAFCLTDRDGCDVALPQIRFPASPVLDPPVPNASVSADFCMPRIDAGQTVAYVFTSGSTGTPVPHRKTWGALVRNVQAEARLCGFLDGRRHAIVGTVPPQHMYGLESTILIAWQSANALVAGQSFYPADICRALASVPHPRALVSTPVHLRSVLESERETPNADLVISATAPLSRELAQTLEARFGAPLLEIYGSTETGQIAVRQSAQTAAWRLFPGVRFIQQNDMTWAEGGHVEQRTPMHDVIECLAGDEFLLHGRSADLINIAGKRSSLGYLNLQLCSVAGVADGAFFMPDENTADGVTRLTAFVVAPGLNSSSLLAGLRQRIDPVFMPRPLVFVDALPRNATGKLPRDALKALADAHARTHAKQTDMEPLRMEILNKEQPHMERSS